MFEVLTVGENPYYDHKPLLKNKEYKEKISIEYK
jgi:hypothetical protein